MKRIIDISDQLYATCIRLNNEGDARPSVVCIANSRPYEERSQGEWIPVSERLPNTLGVYNVTRKLNEGETIYFISGASYFDGQNTWHADTGINHGRPYLTDIIAWQPLPEPYKKGDTE